MAGRQPYRSGARRRSDGQRRTVVADPRAGTGTARPGRRRQSVRRRTSNWQRSCPASRPVPEQVGARLCVWPATCARSSTDRARYPTDARQPRPGSIASCIPAVHRPLARPSRKRRSGAGPPGTGGLASLAQRQAPVRVQASISVPGSRRTGCKPLLDSLGAVRDLDVARTESLPRVANAYIAGDPQRNRQWQQMLGRLRRASASLRKNLLQTLDDPATGQALIRVTQWLDALVPQDTPDSDGPAAAAGPLRAWARRKIRAQRRKLRAAGASTDDIVRLHQVRILAKRLRYGIDALRPVLPPRRAQRWQAMATRLQSGILGQQRDAVLAATLVAGLERSTAIAEFLRGHLAGITQLQRNRASTGQCTPSIRV